jgi:hypothetical protein
LGYLDKEMTIMGILSTFCLAIIVLVIKELDSPLLQPVWSSSCYYIVAALGLILLAALFFYKQRSYLAWYYGQICLKICCHPDEVRGFIDDADSWETWISYQLAFTFLGFAFGEIVVAVLNANAEPGNGRVLGHAFFQLCCSVGLLLIALGVGFIQAYVLTKTREDEYPYQHAFKDIWDVVKHIASRSSR